MIKIISFILTLLISCIHIYSQWNYGSPISTAAPASTWHQVQNRPPFNEMFDSLAFPYPTNAWFNMLYLGQQTYPAPPGIMGANKINPYPYQIGLGSGYGGYPNYKALLSINYKPFQIVEGGGNFPYISWDAGNFCFMGTSDPTNIKGTLLNDYTDLSVTVKFTNTTNSSRYYYAPIIRGMPYITVFYNNTRPGVFFPSPDIQKVNDTTVVPGMDFTNRVFKIQTNGPAGTSNRSQTWMLYSSSPITLRFSNNSATLGLIGLSDFTGWLRLAHVTYQGENITTQQVSDKINLLTAYSKFIPVKGQVAASYTSGSSASVQFNYTRYNEGSLSGDSLLMMALPHHVDMLSNSTTDVLKYAVLKGNMKEVRQKTWNMTENQMPDYTFYPKYGKLNTVPLQWCDTLQKCVNTDFNSFYSRNSLGADIYGQGKILQKMARVAVIADELYERDNTRYASMLPLSNRMRDSLKLFFGRYLNGGHTMNPIHGPGAWDSVFYDTKYGGLISSLGWDSLNVNCCFSYGSAVYNDHHFHYGYPVYAASIIAKTDPGWFTANSNYYLNRVNDLIRDYANPSRSDGYFALMRYKDWYEGHSWANGLVPFGDGKNQESSSEAINAWYGMYLFGSAVNNSNIKNTGALLLAQEMRSVKKYYHIVLPQVNPVYPPFYTTKFHICGNMFQTKLDANIFFPPLASFTIHGIQVIPVTPATEQLWEVNYSKDIFDYSPNGLRFSASFNPNNIDPVAWNWTTICVGVQAQAYPQEALNFYPYYGYNLNNYDNGTSSSNVMYWILTRLHGSIGINQIGTEIPGRFRLWQNYPNPFNPSTTIKFDVPEKSIVKLAVFDLLGREVAEIYNAELNAGSYKYGFDGNGLASGIYFVKINAGEFSDVKKMILVK
ncbi:MAG TPA: glycosyl hydrolase [Ignavibacteria bacterium]|nr:glycosyl hydrolase [Ignavibacteria bacterium]